MNKKFKKISLYKAYVIGVIAVIVLGLVPILAIGFCNHPSADDFSYSVLTHQTVLDGGSIFDVLAAAARTSADFMENWQGLYSASFVFALQPGIFGEQYYALTTPILLLSSFVGFMLLAHAVARYVFRSSSRSWMLLGTLSWWFFVQTMPDSAEGLYWFCGAADYLFFWSGFATTLALVIGYVRTDGPLAWFRLALSTVTAFFTAGGNHVVTFEMLLVLLGFVVVALAKKRKKAFVILPLVAAVVGFYIVMTAPGTAVRSATLSVDPSVPWTFIYSGYAVVDYTGQWMNLSFLCFAIAIAPVLWRILQSSEWTAPSVTPKWIGLYVFGALCLIGAMLCVPLYATRSLGAGRLTDIVYETYVVLEVGLVLLLVLWVSSRAEGRSGIGVAWASKLKNDYFALSKTPCVSVAIVATALIICSYGSGFNFSPSTAGSATSDIVTGKALTYNDEQNERVRTLLSSSDSDVVLKGLTKIPTTIYFDDLSVSASDWRNASMANYYEKSSISLSSPTVRVAGVDGVASLDDETAEASSVTAGADERAAGHSSN